MTYMAMPYYKTPCPGGHEIYNFSRPFLGHHYFIVSFSDICLGIEKKIFKELMHFYYMTYSTDQTQPNRKRTQTGPRVCFRGLVGVR